MFLTQLVLGTISAIILWVLVNSARHTIFTRDAVVVDRQLINKKYQYTIYYREGLNTAFGKTLLYNTSKILEVGDKVRVSYYYEAGMATMVVDEPSMSPNYRLRGKRYE